MDSKVISEIQDYRHLQWSKIRHSSGTAGSFLKAGERIGSSHFYYKLSDFDSYQGIVGHECVNEIIADRLLTLLQIPHLSYQLIHARIQLEQREYVTWLCRSEDFKFPGESKLALDTFYQMERLDGESPLQFCLRYGWEKYIWQMLLVDYLIENRDRHGANMEVLRNRTRKTLRLAPLFDHGLSFVFSRHDVSQLNNIDPLEEKRVQCFVGSNSTKKNLSLIPRDFFSQTPHLCKEDRAFLFSDLEAALPLPYQQVIWRMLWERWQYYESLCNT